MTEKIYENSQPFDKNSLPKLMNEHEVARLICKSVFWLRRDRWKGASIPYRKLGSSVRYDLNDVLHWINQHPLQVSTSEGV